MLLVEVPFARRIWALPVLTALTPSKAWSECHGHRHRTVTEWARLVLLVLRRWLPDRPMVAVMDGEFAALELLHALHPRMAVITRLRKDARLFDPPDTYEDKPGRPARKGKRQPLLSARLTDPATRWLRVVQSVTGADSRAWRLRGRAERDSRCPCHRRTPRRWRSSRLLNCGTLLAGWSWRSIGSTLTMARYRTMPKPSRRRLPR
jgi:hypothetical protein